MRRAGNLSATRSAACHERQRPDLPLPKPRDGETLRAEMPVEEGVKGIVVALVIFAVAAGGAAWKFWPQRPDPTREALIRLSAAIDGGLTIRDLRQHRTEIATEARLAGEEGRANLIVVQIDGAIASWSALLDNLACRGDEWQQRDEGQLSRCRTAVTPGFRLVSANVRLDRRRDVGWEVEPLLAGLHSAVERALQRQ